MAVEPSAAPSNADADQLLPQRPRAAVPPLPESLGYRIKVRLLGPPLHSNELEHQRLGIPTAMAIFSSDNISSSAYATEEILHVLIPVIGVFAFSLVIPITVAMLVVLAFLILSYRETIKEYPTAGGAYMVTRDNFGYKPALVAGVSLLTDYILTVAVSASAGVAALTSLVPSLVPYHLPLALTVVALIAYVNLRGVKESGKVFMVPTYLFMGAMAIMITVGLTKVFGGGMAHIVPHKGAELLDAGKNGERGTRQHAPLRRRPVGRAQGVRLGRNRGDRSGGHLERRAARSTSPSGSTPAGPWSSWASPSACASWAFRSWRPKRGHRPTRRAVRPSSPRSAGPCSAPAAPARRCSSSSRAAHC